MWAMFALIVHFAANNHIVSALNHFNCANKLMYLYVYDKEVAQGNHPTSKQGTALIVLKENKQQYPNLPLPGYQE